MDTSFLFMWLAGACFALATTILLRGPAEVEEAERTRRLRNLGLLVRMPSPVELDRRFMATRSRLQRTRRGRGW